MRTARSSGRPGGVSTRHTPLEQTPQDQAPLPDQAPPPGADLPEQTPLLQDILG